MIGKYYCDSCFNVIPANTNACLHCRQVQKRGINPGDPKLVAAIVLSIIVLIGWKLFKGL